MHRFEAHRGHLRNVREGTAGPRELTESRLKCDAMVRHRQNCLELGVSCRSVDAALRGSDPLHAASRQLPFIAS